MTRPPTIVHSIERTGRAQQGLDPRTASIEKINIALHLLYQASFGLGMVGQPPGVDTSNSTIAAVCLGDSWHVAIPQPAEQLSSRDMMASGIFMGRLLAQSKQAALAVSSDAGNHCLDFKKKEHLVKALNSLARDLGDISPLSDPFNGKPAIEWLSELNELPDPHPPR
ncbi:MAG: hypothetical protein ACOYNL_04570 [Rickettsiales bacterium]